MDKIYVLMYKGKVYRGKSNNKSVYFTSDSAHNAMNHLSKRIARKKIDSWKDYSKEKVKELIDIEKVKFEIITYTK